MRTVSLPEGAEAAALVRCPLCNAEYPLSEAVPPALIIVPNSVRLSSPAASSTPAAGLVTEPFFRQGRTIAPPAVDSDSAGETPKETSAVESPDDFTLDFEEHPAESEPPPAERDESSEVPESALNAGEYPLVAAKPSPDSGENNIAPARSIAPPRARPLLKPIPPRRKRKKSGPIRLLFEWVLGGGMAVVIAYYGIWWIRGESAGLPRFEWLPFLPAEEIEIKAPSKPIPPASNPKTLPRNPEPGAGMQTTVPSVSPVEKNEVAANGAPQIEQTPGDDPSPDIETKTVPLPETAGQMLLPKIGPRLPANFSSLDLDTALQEATDAFVIKGSGKVSAENYPLFCRLAEVQTFIAPDKLSPSQQRNMDELLGTIAKDPRQIAEIGRLGGEAVKKAQNAIKKADEEAKKADAHPGGIFLAGKVAKIINRNGMYGTMIAPAAGGETVPVLSLKPMNFKDEDNVLIAGGMIAKPTENIAAYQGKFSLVIWLGAMVPIPAAADTK
jgi:hypothetical protein